jgi:threonyl-tRNA synthetase
MAENAVSVRLRTGEDIGKVDISLLIERIQTIISTKDNRKL